jgi:hypothetical protein
MMGIFSKQEVNHINPMKMYQLHLVSLNSQLSDLFNSGISAGGGHQAPPGATDQDLLQLGTSAGRNFPIPSPFSYLKCRPLGQYKSESKQGSVL